MFTNQCRCINCITPPHILKKLIDNSDSRIRDAALRTLLSTSRLRGERAVRGLLAPALATSTHGRRTVFDCANSNSVSSATVARTEDGPASADDSVNNAFDGLGSTRDFYKEVFDRDSIDGRGMRLNGYVHFGSSFNNAFWDGSHMVFGDGDGVLFTDFTGSLDVIGHELTHGVTELTAGLTYHNQPGALNESISDVFGSLVKQWARKQTADQADWLIGADIVKKGFPGKALRSMAAPGTAYDGDDQPANMKDYVQTQSDNGGVHTNSGIPNKAFHDYAVALGGNAWGRAGRVWYETLRDPGLGTDAQFVAFARITLSTAQRLYGTEGDEVAALQDAWNGVGVTVA